MNAARRATSDNPLAEDCEESWIEDLNRFDDHIWPLFTDRGYTKGEAHLLFRLTGVQLYLQDIKDQLEATR
jgi:hypothetical protein